MPKKQVYHRWSPTLGGGFAGTPEEVWGTLPYNSDKHINEDVVFCGLYGLPDFYALWRHKGKKYVWFCGSDITHFINGYWLDTRGSIKLSPHALATWINKNCESWVENEVEAKALSKVGIKTKICPSFLGNVDNFKPQETYLHQAPRYYSSVSGNDFKLYGWDKINKLAKTDPNIRYYLYGNTIEWKAPKNVIVRDRLSQEEMDSEIKSMTGAIRLVEFEGFSEIVAKSILWGQKPISAIKYDYDRESLLKVLNCYPWNSKK